MGPAWLDDQVRDYTPQEIAAAILFDALVFAMKGLRHERPNDPLAWTHAKISQYLSRAPGYWAAMAKITAEKSQTDG